MYLYFWGQRKPMFGLALQWRWHYDVLVQKSFSLACQLMNLKFNLYCTITSLRYFCKLNCLKNSPKKLLSPVRQAKDRIQQPLLQNSLAPSYWTELTLHAGTCITTVYKCIYVYMYMYLFKSNLLKICWILKYTKNDLMQPNLGKKKFDFSQIGTLPCQPSCDLLHYAGKMSKQKWILAMKTSQAT